MDEHAEVIFINELSKNPKELEIKKENHHKYQVFLIIQLSFLNQLGQIVL